MRNDHQQISEILLRLGKVSFRESSRFNVTSHAVAGTEFELEHNLGRVPEGFIVIRKDKAGSIFDSGTAWTKNKVFLKSDAVSMNVTLIFI